MPKRVIKIPATVTKIDTETGKETHEQGAWNVLPPAPGKCQICAIEHEPEDPHNAQSLYYQMTFQGMIGRAATWADAMAHCDDHRKHWWRTYLKEINAWTEPPEGEKPVKHCGVEE
jgi:hypothetical protein